MNSARLSATVVAIMALFVSFTESADGQQAGSARTGPRSTAPGPMSLAPPRPPAMARPARRGRSFAQATGGANRDRNSLSLDSPEAQAQDQASEARLEDAVAARQSVNAFNSLEDGQPGAPGQLELQFNIGWQTTSDESDPVAFETELQYTLDGNAFLRNTQLILGVPLELGNGDIDGNADLRFGWQQRWIKEEGLIPTVATLAEVRIPSGDDSSGVDGTLTGILAKDLGPGTLYFNAFGKTVNGDNIENRRDFQWGFRTGYKWRLNDDFALIGDYLLESSEQRGHRDVNALEFSGEYRVNENFTIGPGILIGLDDNDETPNFGAGVRFLISF